MRHICVCVQLNSYCVSILQRGHYGEMCVFSSALCKYDLRKGNLFSLRWLALVEDVYGECICDVVVCVVFYCFVVL